MATTVLLAPQTAAGDTAEFTIKAPASVYLVTSTGVVNERAKSQVLKKVGTGVYEPLKAQSGKNRKRVAIFLSQQEPTYLLADLGTYIIRKSATTQQVGMSLDDNV